MEKENQLVTIEPSRAYDVFTKPNGLAEILASINKEALSIAPDLSTSKGRKEVASSAYRVAQTKTYLESLGKEITEKLKELPKVVDANRKYVRETLDGLRDEVRKPLTDWEAEQERIEAEKRAIEEARALKEQIERDHELALFMNAEFDRKREEAKAEAERLAKERDEAIAKSAKEAAEREAKESLEKAEREKVAAQKAAELAEIQKREAQLKHDQEMKEAQAKAERQAREAAETERQKIESERLEKEAEDARRKADVNHKKKINNQASFDLMIEAGLSEDEAKAVVIAIQKGLISSVTINY